MKRTNRIAIVGSALLLVFVAACSGSPATGGSTPLATIPAGSTTVATAKPAAGGGGGSTEDVCTLFTSAEIGTIVGEPAGAGDSAGYRCEWKTARGSAVVRVQPEETLMGLYDGGKPGHRAVDGIGDKASIGPGILGGEEAFAVANDTFYYVSLDPSPSDTALLDFLRQFIDRFHI